MFKVTLKLYRHQMGALLDFLPHPTELSLRQMAKLTLEEMVLIDYRGKITANQVHTWKHRPNEKPYSLTMPLSVARALWSQLQRLCILSHGLHSLLAEVDRVLKNAGLE